MKEENKIVLGIAYLFMIIATGFMLLSSLPLFLYADCQFGPALLGVAIWFAVAIVIIIIINRLSKRQRQGIASAFRDDTIRKTAGLIILAGGLMDFTSYIPAGINAVSLIIYNAYDPSVIPNVIACIVPLFQILVGVYLLKCKSKLGGEYIAKTVFGVAYFYSVISVALSLLRELSTNISNLASPYFCLRLVCIAPILIVLFRLNRKQNQSFSLMLEDGTIRKSVGVLILVTGIISLSSICFSAINLISQINMNYVSNNYIQSSIIKNIVSFIIVSGQIVFGIYLLRKSKPGGERVTKIVSELIYLFTFIALTFNLVTKLLGHSVTRDQMTEYYSLWFFAIAAICFILYRLSKKLQ